MKPARLTAQRLVTIALLAAATAGAITTAQAEQGDFLFRVGGSVVAPKSDNGLGLEVDDGYMLTFNGAYFVTNNIAVEVLASLPFTHDIAPEGGSTIAETEHLPPTVTAQWHFAPGAKFRPYVGAGFNYTIFFSEDIDGGELELDNSFGYAVQAGFDVDLTEKIFLNADVRYIDIETDAKINGSKLGTVEIDPIVFGLHLGYKFGQ